MWEERVGKEKVNNQGHTNEPEIPHKGSRKDFDSSEKRQSRQQPANK